MLRRRLRLSCSDDEDETPEQPEPSNGSQVREQSSSTRQSVNVSPPNPTPNPSDPLEISDEEFIDVSDNLSPPSPPPPPPPQQPPFPVVPPASSGSFESSGCPISDCLGRLGLRLRREWLDSCTDGLQSSVSGYTSLNADEKAKLCFQQFLFSDMNYSGGGVLPGNVDSMHLVDLPGPFVLQVDEIVNISAPLRGRYQNASCGIKRCLKLSMTDGVQRVFAMEYRPIKALEVLSPAGLKVAICNVHIRHGLMMLVPEAIEVLGGSVHELEAARQRLVEEVNKPPRGKRTRSGEVPSLATRATLAAWQPNVVEHTNSSTSQGANYSEANVQVTLGAGIAQRTTEEFTGHAFRESAVRNPSSSNTVDAGEIYRNTVSVDNGDSRPNPSSNSVHILSSNNTVDAGEIYRNTVSVDNGDTRSNPSSNSVHILSSNNTVDVGDIHMDTVSVNNEDTRPNPSSNFVHTLSSNNIVDVEEIHMNRVHINNEPSGVVPDDENIQIVDQVEHLRLLSGDRENPFTYVANLSGRWAAVKEKATNVKGKVKCCLTGVKGFQFRQRTTYELRVHIDDGSLISDIFIDHKYVQRVIGHSPAEVNAALSSDSQTVTSIKERLKQFQIFLANFEGIMVIEINGSSPLPVALEMNQGCTTSDAWLLLGRLKALAPIQTSQNRNLPSDPIEVSP